MAHMVTFYGFSMAHMVTISNEKTTEHVNGMANVGCRPKISEEAMLSWRYSRCGTTLASFWRDARDKKSELRLVVWIFLKFQIL